MPRAPLVAPVVLAAAAAAALAHGVSPRLDAVETAVDAAATRLAGDAVALRSVKRMAALLDRRSNATSLSAEIAGVAAAARVLETKLAGDAELTAAFDAASAGYHGDLVAARATLVLAAASPSLPAKARTRAVATRTKFDRLVPTGAPKLATPRADALRSYSAAAKLVAGMTAYDGGATHTWALTSLALAPSGQGLDLNGDRTPDNALAALEALAGGAFDVDATLAAAFAQGGRTAVVEMWLVQSLAKGDPLVVAGLLSATGDAGSGYVADAESVGDDGHAALRVATSVAKGGRYSVLFGGTEIPFGAVTLPATAKVLVSGTATDASNSGLLAMGIPIDTVIALADQSGTPLSDTVRTLLGFAADLDLDPAVPGNDALSASFTFSAAAAAVTRP